MQIQIRAPKASEKPQWESLWTQYLAFYETTNFDPHLTQLLWQRIFNAENPIDCLVAHDGQSDELVGLVHFLPHYNTWCADQVCYLEDLFVDPKTRGQGVGEALIEAVVEHAKAQSWANVYWQTKHDNAQARRLYDKLTGGTNGFVIYKMKI